MNKTEKDLLIIGGILAGGLGLYYLFDKNSFHIGSQPMEGNTDVSAFITGFGGGNQQQTSNYAGNQYSSNTNTSCPTGYYYNGNGGCNQSPTVINSCPSGYTANSNGQCIQNTVAASSCPSGYIMTFPNGLLAAGVCSPSSSVTNTAVYDTNISDYTGGSTSFNGLNTGINTLVRNLENSINFYTNLSSLLQACQDVAQRVNDYFPNNSLVPTFVTAYNTAYSNGSIGNVYKEALSGAYNDIQFINNFVQLVNSGYGIPATATTSTATTATSCPTGYTLTNGSCIQNAVSTTTNTPLYDTNINDYNSGNTSFNGLNTGINTLVRNLENTISFYTNSSSLLQACQDVAQRVNDYFPNNSLVPTFVTAYNTAYSNGSIGNVYKEALSGAYNDIQFINNFVQLVNSGYGIPATATTTNPTVNFSNTLGNINGSLMQISGSGNTLSSSTDTGWSTGTSNWVGSGTITYDPSTGFSGTLGNVNGSYTIITGSGNTLNSQTDTTIAGNTGGWVNSGTITYDPASNTFSGTLGDISYSMFAIAGYGNTLVSQTNTYPVNNASPTWVNSGTITATVS